MLWVDPTDPEVIAAVVGGAAEASGLTEEDAEQVITAIKVANELLMLATGLMVHPAGEVTEEFVAPYIRRISLAQGPVTSVSKVVRVLHDDTEHPLTYRRVGQMLYLHFYTLAPGYSVPLWRTNQLGISGHHYQRPNHLYRVTYQFASTVTPAAVQALLTYAHEIFLMLIGSEECGLPERVTSIDREGLGIQLATPQDYLDKGRTGLPSVDMWLSQINPPVGAMRGVGGSPSSRPSQVFTPDSPPGIGTRMRRLG